MTRAAAIDLARSDALPDGAAPVWRFVPLADFTAPPASVAERARTGVRGLLDRLRDRAADPLAVEAAEPLQRLDADALTRIVPAAPAGPLEAALASALGDWPVESVGGRLRLIVTAPYGPGALAVRSYAQARNVTVLAACAPESLLRGESEAVDALRGRADEALVLDGLEGFFLRHPNSLGPLRSLLAELSVRRAPTLVSCESWAWAWLRAAMKLDPLFPAPLALAPLDADGLAQWLGQPASSPALAAREPNGRWVLWPDGRDAPAERSEFMRHLAATSRGLPGVAASIWSMALRHPSDGAFEEVSLPADTATVSITPWPELPLPSLQRIARPEEIALMHVLLLHPELTVPVLVELLPFENTEITRNLAALANARLAEEREGRWRITGAGYPAVRRELSDAGVLADAL